MDLTFISDEKVKDKIEKFNEEKYKSARGQIEDINRDVKLVLDECIENILASDSIEVDEIVSEISREFKDFQYEIRRKNLHDAGIYCI